MRKQILVIAALVLVAGVALWLRGTGGTSGSGTSPAGEPAVEAPVQPSAQPPRLAQGGEPVGPIDLVLDDEPEGPLRLEGQVLGAGDRPAAGVQLVVDASPPRTARSRADGSFAFGRLVPRTYVVTARQGALVGGPVSHRLDHRSDPLVIRLAEGGALSVQVVDEAGAPVAAEVELRDPEPRTAAAAGGVARFAGVPGGFHVVVARARGFAEARQPVQVPGTPGAVIETRVVLRTGVAIAGRVVTDQGTPVVGARVMAEDAAAIFALGDARRDAVVTDRAGRFALPPLAAGSYRFTALHADHAPATEPVVVGGAPAGDVTITMAAGGVLAGTVVDAAGAAVPHAAVRVLLRTQGISGHRVRQTVADEHGAFRVSGLARAEHVVMALDGVASSEVVPVDLTEGAAERRDLELRLAVTGAIAGVVVTAAGEPVAEAQVSAARDIWQRARAEDILLRGAAAATTDGGGHFELRGLPSGYYRVRASRAGLGTASDQAVEAATGVRDVRIVLELPGTLEGAVRFADGGAPELFTVAVGVPPGVPVASASGRFSIPELPPGVHDVTVRGASFAPRTVRDVVIEAGQIRDMGIITVQRGRRVTGRVVDARGAGVAGATVVAGTQLVGDGRTALASLGGGGEELFQLRRAISGEGGFFELAGVGPAELQLIAEHDEHGRSVPVAIPAGTESVLLDVPLRAFGAVHGVVTVAGKRAAGVVLTASPVGASRQVMVVRAGDDGAYAYDRLAEGPHRLIATVVGQSVLATTTASKDVDIVAGQRARLDIDITVGDITLQVVIAGKDGARIDAAQVFLLGGVVSAATAAELTEAYVQAPGGGMKQALVVGRSEVELPDVVPGAYSVCVVPISGDMNDMTFQLRLQEHISRLKVYCEPVTVQASPRVQAHMAVVPPMEPLPDSGAP